MLPTEKTKPTDNPLAYSTLIYGPTKVGKTTFAAQADNAIFLATEPGLNALEVYQIPCPDWPTMLKACGELATKDHKFSTVVIDTVDNAYQFCMEHTCKQMGIAHPSDAAYGKGYSAVNNEFKRVLLKLSHLPIGLILISHSQEKNIETKTGSYSKITTTLPESARKVVIGLMDLVLLAEVTADKDNPQRILKTKPSVAYDAGDRTGRLPDTLPLDYAAFYAAFTQALKPQTKGRKTK